MCEGCIGQGSMRGQRDHSEEEQGVGRSWPCSGGTARMVWKGEGLH